MDRKQLEAEVVLLRNRYGSLTRGQKDDWILFEAFALPSGWNRSTIEVLVILPPGYPATPPDNFFVRNGLRTADGALPSNYSENQTVLGSAWAQFSFHVQEWNPAETNHGGDNLLTFMLGVERRLRECN